MCASRAASADVGAADGRWEKAVRLWRADAGSFTRVYPLFPELPKPSVRRKLCRYQTRRLPQPAIEQEATVGLDEEAIWQRALRRSAVARQNAARRRQVSFPSGPAALVFLADLHLGSDGVDYAVIDRDIDLILETPGMYVCLVGDLLDNFIVGRLKDIRLNGAPFLISEEWVLVKCVLTRLAPRIIASVAGNHDLWTFGLSGIDYLKEVHDALTPHILYDQLDLRFTLKVGASEKVVRLRHHWHSRSQYNDTHGIEKAAKFDKGRGFDVGVGAHTHVSSLVREFNNGGRTGIAVQLGSYKVRDAYASRLGLPQANNRAAAAVVFDELGRMWGSSDLQLVSDYLLQVYAEAE